MYPQLESGMTAKDLVDRREIRKNVTEALTSLPVSSLLDVDQISSALLQSTVSNQPMGSQTYLSTQLLKCTCKDKEPTPSMNLL